MKSTPKIPRGWRKVPIGWKLAKGDKFFIDDGEPPFWVITAWKSGTVLTKELVEVNGIYIRKIK